MEQRTWLRRPGLLILLAKAVLLAGCALYLLKGVDLNSLPQQVASLSPFGIAVFALLVTVSYAIHGYRLSSLAGNRVSTLMGIKCCALGQGVNYSLPSKLGEMAKVLYLNKAAGLTATEATEVVFWERFFDVNCLLVFVLLILSKVSGSIAVISLLAFCGALWFLLVIIRVSRLPLLENMCSLVPTSPVRRFAFDLVKLIRHKLTLPFFLRQTALGMVSLLFDLLHVYLYYRWAGGLALPVVDVLYVFVISAVGYAVPAAPGGLGMYEAAIVFGLCSASVPKKLALTLALVQHLALFAVAFAGLGLVLAMTRFRLASLLPGRGAKAGSGEDETDEH